MAEKISMGIFCGAEDRTPLLPDVYTTLFLEQLESRNFSKSLSALLQNPNKLKQSAGLRQLLITLLADGEKKTLVKLCYGHLTNTVEDNLENICRGLPVIKAEEMYDLIYAFHCERFDFAKAAKSMYEYATRLNEEPYSIALLKKRCDALAVVVMSLGFVAESAEEREEIRREQTIADVRLQLSDLNQFSIPPVEAMLLSCEFNRPPYDLLQEVTRQSILVDRFASDTKIYRDFTLSNGGLLDIVKGKKRPHWKLLKSYVELSRRHWPHDAKILRTVAIVFLGFSLKIPAWLGNQYKAVNFGDFLCSLIEYAELEEAFDHLLSELDVVIEKVSKGNLHDAIVPYTHIDWLLELAKEELDRYAESIVKAKRKLTQLWNLTSVLVNN